MLIKLNRRIKNMSEKQLISKLGKVGNPITLLKMFKDVKKFIGDHQNNFLKRLYGI